MTPYYIYRDCAMSRLSPFRPEEIHQLRHVTDDDASNPAVVYNNGHLAMQSTLFLGPVNFYYETTDGEQFCVEANAGDSNFISPFIKHSFTSREGDGLPAIVAVTYGGAVREALADLGRMAPDSLSEIAGDARDETGARKKLLWRLMASEMVTPVEVHAELSARCGPQRAAAILDGQQFSNSEAQVLSAVLGVRPRDVMLDHLRPDEDVVFVRRQPSRPYPEDGSYSLTPLARTRHQPDLKTFLLRVDGKGAELRTHLHQFWYNIGSTAVTVSWPGGTRELGPGDSAYAAPTVPHSFSGQGEVYIVRIPGRMTKETLDELATAAPNGRHRIGQEALQWY
jgi:methylphosphonate synthase